VPSLGISGVADQRARISRRLSIGHAILTLYRTFTARKALREQTSGVDGAVRRVNTQLNGWSTRSHDGT
jgi:hypothetical protein